MTPDPKPLLTPTPEFLEWFNERFGPRYVEEDMSCELAWLAWQAAMKSRPHSGQPPTGVREAAQKIQDALIAWAQAVGHVMPLPTTFNEVNASIVQSALDSALTAERERRVAAERVIDAVGMQDIKSPEYIFRQAEAYRTKFPKGDDHG